MESWSDSSLHASIGLEQLRFNRGLGAHCWSADGQRYIDLVCGQGPIILGHAHPAVIDAVMRQLSLGTMLPGPGPINDEFRRVLLALFPSNDDILTFKTGSEAVAAAIRLMRASTRRDLVLRIGFQGWHDQFVSPYMRCHSYGVEGFELDWPIGVPHRAYESLISTWDPADLDGIVDAVCTHGRTLAGVVIDPVQLEPTVAARILPKLSHALKDLGAMLIFDESKTGIRVHMGGAQALYGIHPDFTILSKALANGMPLAVVLGRNNLKELAQRSRIKGTFGNETAAIAAALTTLSVMRGVDGPRKLACRGQSLIDGLNTAIRDSGMDGIAKAVPYQWPCLPYVYFTDSRGDLEAIFHEGLVERGVLMLRRHMSFVNLALSEEDVNDVVAAAADTLSEMATVQ